MPVMPEAMLSCLPSADVEKSTWTTAATAEPDDLPMIPMCSSDSSDTGASSAGPAAKRRCRDSDSGFPGKAAHALWLRELESASPDMTHWNPNDPLDSFLLDTSKMGDGVLPEIPSLVAAAQLSTLCAATASSGPRGWRTKSVADLLYDEALDTKGEISFDFFSDGVLSVDDLITTIDAIFEDFEENGDGRHCLRYRYVYAGATSSPKFRALQAPFAHLKPGSVFTKMCVLAKGDSEYVRFWEKKAITVLKETFQWDMKVLNIAGGGERIPRQSPDDFYVYIMV